MLATPFARYPPSQECSSLSPSVWSGIVIHEHKCSTMSCSKWCNVWTQHFDDISLSIHVANNLHKGCLPGNANTSPHHNTPTTIGCNWLSTALCVLFSNSTPHTFPAINVTQATSHLIAEQHINPLLSGLSNMGSGPLQTSLSVSKFQAGLLH